MEPDRIIELADGRHLAVDDLGDPSGRPVLYVHGTPDSRLARHPDASIAAEAGIRLVAVDRPGIGGSSLDPRSTPTSVADDLVAAADALGVDSFGVLTWSAGSVFGLALAGRHPDRVRSLVLAAPLVPADAYADPSVLEGSDDSRRLFADHLGTVSPDELGAELAPWLVPDVIDDALAAEILASGLDAVAHIEGAGRLLVAALQASVAQGLVGIEREVAAQATPIERLLDAITARVSVHVGLADTVTPPAMGRWIAQRLDARLVVHADEGHSLAITRWAEVLGDAAATP